jgi:eukaryotic-like serine/threonine-protein kinase
MTVAIASLAPVSKSQPTTIPTGAILLGRYRVQEQIESDPLYTVYRAVDEVFGEVEVWIKVFKPQLDTETLTQKFPQAAQMAAYVGNVTIHAPRIMGYGFYEDTIPFRVTEVLQGKSLATVMREGPIPLERSLQFLSHIATALQYAHQGAEINSSQWTIVHGDLKPAAIWVDSESGLGEVIKVRHFGLSHLMQTRTNLNSNRVIYWGTPAYSAPEVFQYQITPASDIYSFGVIAYRLLTDQVPIMAQGKTLRDWAKAHKEQQPRNIQQLKPELNLSPIIDDLIMSCLAKDPERRLSNAQAIVETLQQFLAKSTLSCPVLLPDFDFQPAHSTHTTGEQDHGTEKSWTIQNVEEMMKETVAGAAYSELTDTVPGTMPFVVTPGVAETVICDPIRAAGGSLADGVETVEWPDYLPRSEIVFAQTLFDHSSQPTALWAMLTQDEALSRQQSQVYCHFQYQLNSYPVLLWVTMLHKTDAGARWLPCYIDLGKTQGQRLIRSLVAQDSYQILLFGLEGSQYPQSILQHPLSAEHKLYLKNCLAFAESSIATTLGSLADSKALLKQEFLALKSKLNQWNI